MYRYKRILINLNLDENDVAQIKNVAMIAKMAKSEKLYFLFTEKKMDVPADVIRAYPQLSESVADFARERINEMLDEHLENRNEYDVTVIIEEGQVLDEILKQSRINGVDLILQSTGDGTIDELSLGTKLVRKAPCSVLILPKEGILNLENTAVALDFSEYSTSAMDTVLAFVKAAGIKALKMIHVYEVPTGFHKTGKSFEEFGKIMRTHAEKTFSEFKSGFDLSQVQVNELYQLSNQPADAIAEAVVDQKISFLAVGSRGRGAGAAVMLGSVSERLIETLDVPVLAVKQKGAGLGILNAIFS